MDRIPNPEALANERSAIELDRQGQRSATTDASDESAVVIRAWNTVLFDKFLRFRHLVTSGLSGHSDEFFKRRPFPKGARVLDVGCGFGDTTLEIAALVGATGSAVGVDCAERFIAVARRDAAETSLENVSFHVADVQTAPLGGPFDQAFSRFGTMFFGSPGAALRNVRRCLVPGGKLTFIVWRRREDNGWLHEAEQCVKRWLPVVSHEETDQVHCGPGPFSMAGPDLVSQLLLSAGFRRIAFERVDQPVCIGKDLNEALAFALALGPAGEILRLAGDAADSKKAEIQSALSETLRQFERTDGVWGPSSAWLVTAENP